MTLANPAQCKAALAAALRDLEDADPVPYDPKPPQQYKPGTRRASHVKHTKQRWAAS